MLKELGIFFITTLRFIGSQPTQTEVITALLEHKRFAEAVTEMRRPSVTAEELLSLGMTFNDEKQKHDESILCFDEAIRKAPKKANYYRERGHAYLLKKDYNKALADFEESVKLKPGSEGGWYSMIYTLSICDQFSEDRAKGISFVSIGGLQRLGNNFCDQQKYTEAIFIFTTAINKNKSLPSNYQKRSDCYFKMKKVEEAFDDLERAVDLNPNNGQGRIRLSNLLFDFKKYDKALEVLENVQVGGSPIDHELLKLGNRFSVQSMLKEAIKCYTKALEINSKNVECYQQRAICQQELGNHRAAISDFRNCLGSSSSPRHDLYYPLCLCESLIEVGEMDEAKEIFQDCEKETGYVDPMLWAEQFRRIREKLNQMNA